MSKAPIAGAFVFLGFYNYIKQLNFVTNCFGLCMILMKTKGTLFKDIWETNGIAPFNSKYVGKDILNFIPELPLKAIGFYSGTTDSNEISLLEIHQINLIIEPKRDIQIHFKFVKKLSIKSVEFERKIKKFTSSLLSIHDDDKIEKILRDLKNKNEDTISNKSKDFFLSQYFYEPTDWKKYETKIAELFTIFGFNVQLKGHRNEKERVADIYCYSPPNIEYNKFSIIIDCKNKGDYAIIAEDERAMKEYIENEKSNIFDKGIKPKNVFFLFTAHSFSNYSLEKLKEIAKSTNTYGALISNKNLLYLTEIKLRMGYKLYLEHFPKLFDNIEITISRIDEVFDIY